MIAFTESIAEQVGPSSRWFHYGLTSSDVVDTGLALQLRDAGAIILASLDRAIAAVEARAIEHRDTPCIGRTHGVHAEPTTFGLKLLGWACDLHRNRERLSRARWTASASASCRAPSAPTATSTRASRSTSPARSASASRRPRRR